MKLLEKGKGRKGEREREISPYSFNSHWGHLITSKHRLSHVVYSKYTQAYLSIAWIKSLLRCFMVCVCCEIKSLLLMIIISYFIIKLGNTICKEKICYKADEESRNRKITRNSKMRKLNNESIKLIDFSLKWSVKQRTVSILNGFL